MQLSQYNPYLIKRESQVALICGFVAGVALLGMLYVPLAVLLIIVPLAIFYFSLEPFHLLLAMVFLIPFNFIFLVGSIPIAAELVKVFVWIPFLVHAYFKKITIRRSRFDSSFAVIAILVILSCYRANDLAFTLKESLRFLSSLGLVYVVTNLVETKVQLRLIIKMLAISSFLVALYGFYQFAIQDFGSLFWIINPRLDTSFAPNRISFWEWRNRITSVLTSEMELGHYFNLCIPLSCALYLTQRTVVRWFWAFNAAALFIGLILTFTFGAWIALGVTTLLYLVYFQKISIKGNFLWACAFLPFAFLIVRLLNLGPIFEEKRTLMAWNQFTRLQLWDLAWSAFLSHPIVGIGLGNFSALSAESFDWLNQEWAGAGTTPHNIYFFTLSQFGFVGFLALFGVAIRSIGSMLRIAQQSFNNLQPFALALAWALTTVLVGGVTDDSSLFGPKTSYIFGLYIGLTEVVSRLSTSQNNGA